MTNVSTIVTAVTAFTITTMLGMILIPMLKKLKFGQSIKEDGPSWHKGKQGTPTMGGIMFIVGTAVSVILGYASLIIWDKTALDLQQTVMLFAGLVMAILFGLIGFLDDYIKVVKKQNEGLKAGQKIILQILVATAFLTALYIFGDRSTIVNIPFLGAFDFKALYYPIMGILIIGIVNSANLTDGIDGLATSVTFVIGIFFMLASSYLALLGMNILATALSASCIGFLVFNAHPAKVFMGDTGSLFLGGVVIALGFGLHMEFILFFVGFIYCCESLSVILQVISFKTTGKRIFRMSPIHHHFEMGGMSENKIVTMFTGITVLMCVIAFFAVIQIR
ncbi:MAG: phospho-N-acetylmuramoyl-pentapeptide-transferase [Oscillospiraceae bacterium]